MGDVVTNRHVVDRCGTVQFVTSERRVEVVRIIAAEAQVDLAVLSTAVRPEAFARLRTGSSVALGADVVALGFTLGELLGSQVSATRGNVSSQVRMSDDTTELTITVPIQPGNSGGPLLDTNGLLVGVVVATLHSGRMLELTGAVPQNVNVAIKSLVVQAFLEANGIDYGLANPSEVGAMTVEQVVRQAAGLTVRIECLG